jgi:hypothetical protein
MDAARKAGHTYFLRFVLVAFALPLLPAAGFGAACTLGIPGPICLGIGAVMLVVWGFLARQVLGRFRVRCPQCGRATARIESSNEKALLIYPECGWKEDTGYQFTDE